MNKISKKIVALVTMAAFVLTLVPAAAFAAAPIIGQNIKLDASYLAIVNGKDEAQAEKTVETGEVVTAKYFLNDSAEKAVVNTSLSDKNRAVVFWATENENDGFDKAVSVLDVTASNTNSPTVEDVTGSNAKRMAIATQYGTEVKFSFDRTGTYYLHAGVLKDYTNTPPADTDYTKDNIQELDVYSVVTVEKAAQVVDKVELTATDDVFPGSANNDTLQGNSDSTTVTLNNALLPNSIIEYTLTGVAKDSADGILAGETFNLTSNSDNLVLSKDTVTTAPDGSFNISFSLKKAGDYRITLHNSDVNYTINVVYDSTNADIKTVTSNGETLLAGNDTQNYVGDNRPANYAAAVEFEITDPDGGVVTGNTALANEPAAHAGAANHADFLKIDSKPEGSKLAASDLILVANNDSYTLQYVGDDAARDLIPGEYTVTVSLLNGEYATAKMTFAKYGTTQNVVLDITAVPTDGVGDAVQNEDITDQVKLGRTVTVLARYVDENGVKIVVQDATYGFEGKAVDNSNAAWVGTALNQFRTRADEMFNESLFGTTITVTAFDGNKKEIASQELTVVDAYTENSLAFDKTSGEVDTNNNVTVSVVDADGNVVPVTGNLDAYVADQSNVDADVTVKVAKDMTNGKDGKLILNSDKATTADIVVSVKAGNAQYYGTLNYTFGDVNGVGTSVVMTIGSSEYVINNELVTGDAAPYVADSRTMVPIRALTEAFGAKVDYDNDARTVTIVNNDTTIVMTVGETTYTVNDAEKTMDVAPVIGSGDRAYVPVRFVAEALGYTVTPLYAADGTTASVYFTM